MPTTLDEFSPAPGRPQIYPWDEWTDGKIRRFKEGVDFNGTVRSFRVLVHKTAKVYGLRATTKSVKGEDNDGTPWYGIEVQFHGCPTKPEQHPGKGGRGLVEI